jgi:hypothetical protein
MKFGRNPVDIAPPRLAEIGIDRVSQRKLSCFLLTSFDQHSLVVGSNKLRIFVESLCAESTRETSKAGNTNKRPATGIEASAEIGSRSVSWSSLWQRVGDSQNPDRSTAV